MNARDRVFDCTGEMEVEEKKEPKKKKKVVLTSSTNLEVDQPNTDIDGTKDII